jgi:putative cardiolipin synthase
MRTKASLETKRVEVAMRSRKLIALSILLLVTSLAILTYYNRLPPLGNRTASSVITDTVATRLGKGVTPLVAAHPGVSGVYPVRDARDAFAARHLLATAAEKTLDVQYYIWRDDLSGTLLMKALVDAADRGVRVRLLLDDNNTSGLDDLLSAIDAHPGIEVRLFNPFAIRSPRVLAYLTDLPRLNRRMHNKSFTADDQVTIIGGRNVGDEYFGATDGVLFSDLDVIGIGPVVHDVSKDFDRYWASESAYPAERLLASAGAAKIAELSAKAARVERDRAAVAYMDALRRSSFVSDALAGTLPFEWAVTRMISDPPAKVLGRADRKELLFQRFGEIFGKPSKSIDLVSPYFVPGLEGVDLLGGWAQRGVKVRVLTNSLEATDVAVVHAGYAKRRKALLETGVALYEMRTTPSVPPAGRPSPFGSSSASLHAKTFAVDRERIFVGSFNFDPRSAELNTEMGFVIDSPALARRMAEVFDKTVPMNAYEVRLSGSGDLVWLERHGQRMVRHRREPGAGFWKRIGVALSSALPIDSFL